MKPMTEWIQRRRRALARWRAQHNLGRRAALISVSTGVNQLQNVLLQLVPGQLSAVAVSLAAGTLTDIATRVLSPREQARVDRVAHLASVSVEAKLRDGATPRAGLDSEEMAELIEGVLLTAKDTYEERKLPLLANLVAAAPFTGTPLTNLVGALHVAESLTYRQLCILAVIKSYVSWPSPDLTSANLANLFSQAPLLETTDGILNDLVYLVGQNLVVHAPGGVYTGVASGDLIPSEMVLTYPGLLLYNGMQLAGIPAEDLTDVVAVLGAPPSD